MSPPQVNSLKSYFPVRQKHTFLLHVLNTIHSQFQKKCLIRNALESSEPGASNGGANLKIRFFRADLAAFEVAGRPRISKLAFRSLRQDSRFWPIQRLQKPPCPPQSVGFASLTHDSLRQDQGFPAHFELAS